MKCCPNCHGHGIVSYDPSLQSEALVTWCDECKGTGVDQSPLKRVKAQKQDSNKIDVV